MIKTSDAFREAIVGSPRKIELLAVVDISDPDKVMLPVTASPEAPWSRKEQLHDYELDIKGRYATGERGRWLGDGSFDLFPDDYTVPDEVGYAGKALSGPSGAFFGENVGPAPLGGPTEYEVSEKMTRPGGRVPQAAGPTAAVERAAEGGIKRAAEGGGPYIQLNFSGVRVLQAFSLYFSTDPVDGVPADFTVEVFAGSQLYYTQTVEGNRETEVQCKGFTVYNPTAVKLTVTRWSLPFRRVRAAEMVMGYFERWDGGMLAAFSATLQGQFSCLSLPYGSVHLAMDNSDRRFEPRRKDSIFQSIEERQGVELFIGCQTSAGLERIKTGVFYQAGDGWKTSSNELTMKWYLVDIIGLIANRTFIVPEALPSTLEGWLKALVSQLGAAFENRYKVDPAYAGKPVTANRREDVTGKKCGDILRWACQASGTWPRADQTTGALCAEPLWNQGNKIDLDNLNSYPTMKANESLAALIFQLAVPSEAAEAAVGAAPLGRPSDDAASAVERAAEGGIKRAAEGGGPYTEKTEFVVSGNSTTSEKTVTIINPFLHTQAQALAAARLILAQYGGNVLELTGRGDPSSEIGDVDTVWLDESGATTARRMSQTFNFQGGVMQQCRSTLLQADGSYLWENFAIIRESGTWKAPPGVRKLRVVKVDGGQGSGPGGDGWVGPTGNLWGSGVGSGYGDPGVDGQGGAVWYGVIDCNEEQEFAVQLGKGGAPGSVAGQPGALGGRTVFGAYDGEGRVYENGYTDIANGQTFARTGVPAPAPGTGDGGKGGEGGEPGAGYFKSYSYTVPGGFKPDGSPVVNTRYEFIITKEPGKGKPGVAGATGVVMVTWDKVET